MRKTSVGAVVACLLAIGLVGVPAALARSASASSKTAVATKTGSVVRINRAAHRFELATRHARVWITAVRSTRYSGSARGFTRLRKGDKVSVRAQRSAGGWVATRIQTLLGFSILVNGCVIVPWTTCSNWDLKGADLSGNPLGWANFSGSNLTGASLQAAHLDGANLSSANLTEANMQNMSGPDIDMHGANLTKANLWQVSISRSNLSNAKLPNANLGGGAYLNDANFTNADLTNASLSEAHVDGTNFTGANVTGVNWYHVKFCHTILPNGKKDNDDC